MNRATPPSPWPRRAHPQRAQVGLCWVAGALAMHGAADSLLADTASASAGPPLRKVRHSGQSLLTTFNQFCGVKKTIPSQPALLHQAYYDAVGNRTRVD